MNSNNKKINDNKEIASGRNDVIFLYIKHNVTTCRSAGKKEKDSLENQIDILCQRFTINRIQMIVSPKTNLH